MEFVNHSSFQYSTHGSSGSASSTSGSAGSATASGSRSASGSATCPPNVASSPGCSMPCSWFFSCALPSSRAQSRQAAYNISSVHSGVSAFATERPTARRRRLRFRSDTTSTISRKRLSGFETPKSQYIGPQSWNIQSIFFRKIMTYESYHTSPNLRGSRRRYDAAWVEPWLAELQKRFSFRWFVAHELWRVVEIAHKRG